MADKLARRQDAESEEGVVRERVVTDVPQPYTLGERIVGLITGLLLSLLTLRFVLLLFGANRANPFANFIYGVTYPLVAPFYGLFGYTVQYGVARVELESVFAVIVYALLGYGIMRLLALGQSR